MNSVHYRIAIAATVALLVAAVFASIWNTTDDPGLQIGDLLRLEEPSVAPAAVATEVEWSFELFQGERRIEASDMADRLSPSFSAAFTADDLNGGITAVIEDFGPIHFVRYEGFSEVGAEAIGVSDSGMSFVLLFDLAPDGRIDAWSLDDFSSQARIAGWHLGLALAAAWVFFVIGVLSYQAGRRRDTLILLAGGVGIGSVVLVLDQATLPYTLGRVLPAAGIFFAIWQLLEVRSQTTRLALLIAGAAAAAAGVAPLLRDAALIGHPEPLAVIVDSAGAYRTALVVGAALTTSAVAIAAFFNLRQLTEVPRWRRSVFVVAGGIAVVWALVSVGTAVDYTLGDGQWAEGGLRATSLGLMASVPLVVAYRSATSRWNRPELAGLVIDLEARGSDLRGAVANALEDSEIRVLKSPDGASLYDEEGEWVDPSELAPGLAFTRIQTGGKLVGGLVHRSAHRQHPERLGAVMAAVGMALEVGRLNDKVVSQLQEVEASRTRIVNAGDDSRRRMERDLHDGAQQRLVALGIDLQRARRMARSSGNAELESLLDSATASVRGTIEDIRAVSRGSHPALLTERGLDAAVEALAERSPVPVSVSVDVEDLDGGTEVTVYYVIAEALTNLAKHAAASEAAVVVSTEAGSVIVKVVDDGSGGAVASPGSGLQGLDDRVSAAGGELTIFSDGTGTLVQAVLPCE